MNIASEVALAAAREKFFSGHTLPDGLVPAPILRSWQRCADQGLDAGSSIHAEPMTAAELRALHEQNETLRLLSRSELVSLRIEAKLTDSVVILTDAKGLVLDTAGSPEFAGQAAAVSLRPGVRWAEDSTGTNAIGTALAERRAIEVHGGEHFFVPHGILHCAASPIFDPYGKLAGVLDMSGHASAQHTHAMGLIRLAVEQIEHRFFSGRFDDMTVVRFHRNADLVGTAREGILVFNGDQLVAGNRRALHFAGLDRKALRKATREEIFEASGLGSGSGELRGRNGERYFASLSQPRATVPRVTGTLPRQVSPAKSGPVFTRQTLADLARAIRLVNAEVPLLITGETGAGKEVFARHLAGLTSRAGKPFIAINCAALPESLIESELFGYEAGAFTGARKSGAKGLVQQAEGGILFLDEIGDMPLLLQSRLLRVLQDKEVAPLGGGTPHKTDFMPICATNRDLKAMVEAGTFRADLYFRVAQYTIALPSLSELPDREAVVANLWSRYAPANSGPLPQAVLANLAARRWPGNFRELAGTLRALAALAEPGIPIALADLPQDPTSASPSPIIYQGDLGSITEATMRRAVSQHQGNISAAARALNIDRSTLYRRLVWKQSDTH
ncbi:sigma-54-dependent Fis family transcriptional regulator [Devosia sp. SL43]|uniref:sigma-54-dependent Fis family transcriptional regulator n=1 Tax=Devosia sp. SL43 TaxID=2806348 RepID=UPI001F19D342|nr:sigma-54-dependent Fis family transcriptional regulator [Devosia sp. SL43]UJW86819.1 sigma-54-dependent Fis family transcriptional regulator [Devosia sp. SL43]